MRTKLISLFIVAASALLAFQYLPPNSGSGNATSVNGATVPTSASYLGSNSSGQLISVSDFAYILAGNVGSGTVGNGATDYLAPFATSVQTVEGNAQIVIPITGHIKNLYVNTITSQPSTGSLVFTARTCTPSSGACTGTGTALTCTVASSGGAGTCTDTSDSVAVTAGQLLSLGVTNNASTSSCEIRTFSIQLIVP